MSTVRRIRRAFRLPFRSSRDAWAAVDEELDFHIDMRTAELVAAGIAPEDARERATREFGDLQATRAYCARLDETRERRAHMITLLGEFFQDARYAGRALRRNPGFSLVVVLTLAFGIAANTAIFSLINPYLVRELPFGDAHELVQVNQVNPVTGWDQDRFSPPMVADWKARSRAFQDMATYRYTVRNASDQEGPERVQVGVLSANMFSVLRAEPALGRTFLPGEDGPAGADVVVMGHGLWQRRYAGDPGIVGRVVTMDGVAHTVIGVMPPRFNFPFGGVKLWVPVRDDPARVERGDISEIIVGRLNEGWTAERARAELTGIQRELSALYPDADGRFQGVTVLPMRQALNFAWDIVSVAAVVMLIAVFLVLAIACVNVASLTLARASSRTREVAVRAAIGAGRGRLIRHFVAESVLLAVAGGALGVFLAYLFVSTIGPALPEDLYRVGEASIDGTVLAFTALVTLATPLLFGLVPALGVSRTDLGVALKEGGAGAGTGAGAARGRQVLVIAEVALAIVLISGAGLMIRSFMELQQVSLGYDPDRILTVEVTLPQSDYADAAAWNDYFDRALAEIGAVPGVRAVGVVNPLPLNHESYGTQFALPELAGTPGDQWPAALYTRVSPGYFGAMGVSLLAGRPFNEGDGPDVAPVVIVNRALAERYWPGGDPVGQTVLFGDPTDEPQQATVVGVVSDVKHSSIDGDAGFQMYRPLAQSATRRRFLVLRVDGAPASVAAPVRQALSGVDAALPVSIRPMEGIVLENTLQWSFPSLLLAIFGLGALLLAALGIYGIISYSATRRRREMGIRIALGARAGDVRRVVVGEGLRLTAIGVLVGLALAMAGGRVMAFLLFGVSPFDPVTFGVVVALFVGVALMASLLPALQASRVDPVRVLKAE